MHTETVSQLLLKHFNWHLTRINLFSQLVFSILNTGSVCLKDLALPVTGNPKNSSVFRPIQRFFKLQNIDFSSIIKLILGLIKIDVTYTLAIDRTNCMFGKVDINFLVVSIVFQNISIPICWSLLRKKR